MKALTRREVIDSWNKNKQFLDSFVCPDCRDVLTKSSEAISLGLPEVLFVIIKCVIILVTMM